MQFLKSIFKLSINSIPLICVTLGCFDLRAYAEGSRDMYPQDSQGNRGNILWTTKTWGSGFYERTLLRVFAKKDEYILMGSSAVGLDNGDILLYKPGTITGDAAKENLPNTADFSCQRDQIGRGKIQNRTEELAGAKPVSGTDNPNGYTPCYYRATETGVYYIAMYGPIGSNSTNNGDTGVESNIENINTGMSQDTGISAWDVTVRSSDSSTTDITGRLFTFVLSLNMGDNGRQLHSDLYLATVDGYRYKIDIRGLDPFTFRIFGNQVGIFDSDGKTPLYHNALGEDGGVSNPEGGVSTAPPQFPIFFNPIDENALDYITQYNTKGQIIGSGISRFPIPPDVSNPNFAGSVLGDTSEVSDGGNFTFDTTNNTGIYEIVLSHDGSNFDPTHPRNRVLRGVINQSGRQTTYWNSRDNSGNFFPVGNYTYKISVHAGEYHFPISDAENNFYGGPTITLLNAVKPPPLGPTTTFFDDRGYVTINGTQVGDPNKPLCGVNPPNPAYSDPINGIDSSTPGFRVFGTASGGNANRKCGSNRGNIASFGDTKTLDTWTFVPSPPAIKQLEIVDAKIAGNVYEDIDREDDFDKGEEPVLPKNITIKLLDNNGNQIGSTETDSNGFYAFTGLASGNYKVEVDTSDSEIPEVYALGTKKTIDVVVTIDKTAIVNFGFDRKEGLCDLGGGVNDSGINSYISAEVKNNNANSRKITDSLDDDWRAAATGVKSGAEVQPWFGSANSLGNVNNFSYIDPVTDNTISTTVELVEVPIDGANECEGLTKTSSSNPLLSTSTTLQESSPRPASLYNTSNQPAFWNQTRTSRKDGRRFAVRFNFNTPVKSFGAWFGDLETRSEYATPAILRLLDASGNRIGKDITIEPTQLYDGSSSNPQTINQIQCGSSAFNTGCGNKSTRWVGFIDNYPVPRVAQALVIVGDDDFNDNADTEILSFIGVNVISNHPNVLLVKRITAINGDTTTKDGDDLGIYNQDDSNYYDDNEIEGRNLPTQTQKDTDKWPNTTGKTSSNFLIGGIKGGKVKPGDEIEYTIYFLSTGETEAKSVLVCDRIPENVSFVPNSFNNQAQATGGLQNTDRGILWLKDGNTESLTNVKDGDAAQYFPPGVEPSSVYPKIKCDGANNNGAVVVNLGNLPNATAPGTPTGSYGFVRFRGRVK